MLLAGTHMSAHIVYRIYVYLKDREEKWIPSSQVFVSKKACEEHMKKRFGSNLYSVKWKAEEEVSIHSESLKNVKNIDWDSLSLNEKCSVIVYFVACINTKYLLERMHESLDTNDYFAHYDVSCSLSNIRDFWNHSPLEEQYDILVDRRGRCTILIWKISHGPEISSILLRKAARLFFLACCLFTKSAMKSERWFCKIQSV